MVAELFQAFDESPSRVFRLQPVKKVGPGVAVRLLALDHVVGHDQHRVGDRENRALLAAPRRQPPVLRTEIGAFGARGGVAGLHQGGPQEAIALAGLARRAFAGAFMVAGATPAQEARWSALGKRVISVPISATIISAVRRATPGIVSSRLHRLFKGPQIAWICASKRAMVSSRLSI